MITFGYNPTRDKHEMRQFFEVLPFVLPCKYCRANLAQHYEKLPLEPALVSRETLTRWLYDIHNLVNAKLRGQRVKVQANPPFDEVKEIYGERLEYGCTRTTFPGWEFLFSIVETHPLTSQDAAIPNAPPLERLDQTDKKELLKWNYLSKQCRFEYMCRFWSLLPKVLPYTEWRDAWKDSCKEFCKEIWTSKPKSLRSLYKLRKDFEAKLDLYNRTTFHDLCNDLKFYKSGCAAARFAKTRTCRRLRRKTMRLSRR
jgi:hypothetical protein